MDAESPNPPQTASVDFTVEGDDFRLSSRVTVPAEPVGMRDLLPFARAVSDAVVGKTCQTLEQAGEPISCKKGCGACCRNLVAISEVEARQIRELVEGLPEARRSAVRARFAEARERLEQAGLLQQLQAAEQCTAEDYGTLVGTYFEQGIACPFLEDESCSIHEERPITCREYLVTSPPEHCAKVGSEGVKRVRLPLTVFNAVARCQVPPGEHLLERWVPLVLAPEWAESHPDEPPPKPGPELLRELLDHLNG